VATSETPRAISAVPIGLILHCLSYSPMKIRFLLAGRHVTSRGPASLPPKNVIVHHVRIGPVGATVPPGGFGLFAAATALDRDDVSQHPT